MDAETRRSLIARYRSGAAAIDDALACITDDELDRRPSGGGWSAREVVHHLADAEMRSGLRLRQLLAETNPVIPAYDEEQYARRLFYDRPVASALETIAAVRTSSAEILDRLDD